MLSFGTALWHRDIRIYWPNDIVIIPLLVSLKSTSSFSNSLTR